MKIERLAASAAITGACIAAVSYFWTGQPRLGDERARYEAQHQASELNAKTVGVSIDELHKRAGVCPLPTIESDLFGMKQTVPDYGTQLECQSRMLYGDFYDHEFDLAKMRQWVHLPVWVATGAVGAALVTIFLWLAALFVNKFWWPWVSGK